MIVIFRCVWCMVQLVTARVPRRESVCFEEWSDPLVMRSWSLRAMLVLSDYVHNLIMRIRVFSWVHSSARHDKNRISCRVLCCWVCCSSDRAGSEIGQVGRSQIGWDKCTWMWIGLSKCEYLGSEGGCSASGYRFLGPVLFLLQCLVMLLVSLESFQWIKVYQVGFIMFQLIVKNSLKIIFSWKFIWIKQTIMEFGRTFGILTKILIHGI